MKRRRKRKKKRKRRRTTTTMRISWPRRKRRRRKRRRSRVTVRRIASATNARRVAASNAVNCPQAAYDPERFPKSCVHSSFMGETLDYAAALAALCGGNAGGTNGSRAMRPASAALLLEDDVEASETWMSSLRDFLQHRAPPHWAVVSLYVPNMEGITEAVRKIDGSVDGAPYHLTCCTQVCFIILTTDFFFFWGGGCTTVLM